jgi:uncharacterized membrane protein YphA (DoxX/SURF4 family)
MIALVVLAVVLRLGLGAVFLRAGAHKLGRVRSVRSIVTRYRIVPPAAAAWVARGLGPAELLAGASLWLSLVCPFHAFAWGLASGLMLVFVTVVALALARGIRIPCGCGLWVGSHVVTGRTLARNVVLLFLLLLDRWLTTRVCI